MAGIQSLLGGGLKSFGVDKLSENLSPRMREFLPFALNPQGYIVGKAVNSLADILGYGNEVKELQADAKGEKEYYKETMRDAIGNVLPESIGDFVRATPRANIDEPASTYWDSETQSWKESNSPIVVNPYQFENTLRNETYGTMTPGQGKYVGPLPEDNAIFQANVSNLPYDLGSSPTEGMPKDFDIELLKQIINGNRPGGDFAPREYEFNDGGYCPAPWINILLAGGGTVKAGDIKPGMEVYTRHETTNEWGVYPVSAVEMSEDTRWEVLLEDGRSFVGSANHRVHTGDDWTEIHALKAGDKLVQPEGFGVVKSSAKLDHGPVVRITVADAHTYISEGFLSHNVKMMDFGGGGVGGGGINFDDAIEQFASYATGGKIYTSKR